MMKQFIWLNFMLVIITCGYTTTAYVLYIISMLFLIFSETLNMHICESAINKDKKVDKSISDQAQDILAFFGYDNKEKHTIHRSNIICSYIIHGVLAAFVLDSMTIAILLAAVTLYRCINSLKMEKLVCQN